MAMEVAKRHPSVKALSYDLPPVQPVAADTIAAAGLADRVVAVSGDFLEEVCFLA